MIRFLPILLMLLIPLAVEAAPGINVVTSAPTADGGQNYSLSIQILLLMTVLSLIPGALLMMTSLARILIVFPYDGVIMHSPPLVGQGIEYRRRRPPWQIHGPRSSQRFATLAR